LQDYYVAAGVVVRDDAAAISDYLRGRGALWLAEIDGMTIGCIVLRPLDDVDAHACEVKRLYVREAYRGAGVAGRLHDALEAFARSAGFHWMYLDTASACRRRSDSINATDTKAANVTTTIRKRRSSCERYSLRQRTPAAEFLPEL